jgi:hypothetical protein
MPKTRNAAAQKTALSAERRTSPRLRALITELRGSLAATRGDLDLQVTRLAQLQAQVDALKRRNG